MAQALEPMEYKDYMFPHLADKALYERRYNELYLNPNFHDLPVRNWMKKFHPKACSSILELGAGMGANIIYLAKLGHTVDGVEIAQNAVDAFHRKLEKEPPHFQDRVSLVQGWIEDFEPKRLYDYVLCCEVLEHVIDPVEILKAVKRCLKPDGEAYVTAPTFRDEHDQRHVRVVYEATMVKWTDEAGLMITWSEQTLHRVYCKLAKIPEGANDGSRPGEDQE